MPSSTPATPRHSTQVAQLIQAELALIGITVEIKAMPVGIVYDRAGRRGEPFDMALANWFPVYTDPSDLLNFLFDGRSIRAMGNSNHSYFDDPVYNRKLATAAALTGPRRYADYRGARGRPPAQRGAGSAAPELRAADTSSLRASAARSTSPSTESTSPRSALSARDKPPHRSGTQPRGDWGPSFSRCDRSSPDPAWFVKPRARRERAASSRTRCAVDRSLSTDGLPSPFAAEPTRPSRGLHDRTGFEVSRGERHRSRIDASEHHIPAVAAAAERERHGRPPRGGRSLGPVVQP